MVAPISAISLFHLPPVTPVRAPFRVQRDAGGANGGGLETPQDIVAISGGNGDSSSADDSSSAPATLPGLPQSPSQPGQAGTPPSGQPDGQSDVSTDGTSGADGSGSTDGSTAPGGSGSAKSSDVAKPGDQTGPNGKKLTHDQKAEIQKLQQTDRKVRQHEAAHAAAGGGLAGAPSFDYETGPDGRQYAIGGEVSIKVPSVSSSNPQGTIAQLEQVIRAALAPADPSGQDRAVAAEAQAEIAQEEAVATRKAGEKQQPGSGRSGSADAGGGSTDASGGSTAAPGATGDSDSISATTTGFAAPPGTPGADGTREGASRKRLGPFGAFQAASAIGAAAAGQIIDVQA